MTDNRTRDSRWVESVVKMIKMTQSGKLRWRPDHFPSPPNLDTHITDIYSTVYKGKQLRIYKIKQKRLRTLFDAVLDSSKPVGEAYWTTETVLEFTTGEGDQLWRFPEETPINDLLTSVKYQVAGVNDFLDEILNDED